MAGEPLSRLRLLQLVSPAFPVGAFSYSQGLEAAVEAGTVRDEASAGAWIGDVLGLVVARFEAPCAARMLEAAGAGDWPSLARHNAFFVAARETAELRAETLQMGHSMRRAATDLGAWTEEADRALGGRIAYPAAFAVAATRFGVPNGEALCGYVWSWLENQVMAALKCVRLGQSAGQRLLARIAERVPDLCARALTLPDEEMSSFAPGLAILSSRHETQYSRLFRS